MSHYSVGVIVPKHIEEDLIENYVSKVLEPFSENLEVEPYISITVDELSQRHNDYSKRLTEEGRTDEIESFEDFSNDYCGYGNDEKGNALSCYNPKSKWDWYVIGGRWSGIVETKESKELDYAKIKDILFEKEFSETELKQLEKTYLELTTTGDFYKPEYYQKRYPDFKSFLESKNFSTYALLDTDGEWYEPGEMGWFGMSNSTPEEQKSFDEQYMDLIAKQDKDNWLVVVDCHI